jgi:hypothetical protein
MSAAEYATVRLYAVADDTAAAVLAGGRHGVNRALEAVERPSFVAAYNLEGLVVLVARKHRI